MNYFTAHLGACRKDFYDTVFTSSVSAPPLLPSFLGQQTFGLRRPRVCQIQFGQMHVMYNYKTFVYKN